MTADEWNKLKSRRKLEIEGRKAGGFTVDFPDGGRTICECDNLEDANLIAAALTLYWKQPGVKKVEPKASVIG